MTIKYVTLAALGAALGSFAADACAADQQAEVVIEWNQLLQANLTGTAGLQSPRYYAMMHIAIFDAVNSIAREYSSYRVTVPSSRGASQEAAAAQAAHDVLTALIPTTGAVQTFDAALAAKLVTIEPGRAMQGVIVGKNAAAAVLAWRQNDGWEVAPPPYVLPPLSGLWQPTPPAFAPAGFTQFPGVKPFALLSATQFLPPRFPELTSSEYAVAFDEVKLLGAANSATRTVEQTQTALLFAGVITSTPMFAVWNNVTRDVARSHSFSLVDTARVFALVNASINDGVQTSHTSKFIYGLWRPVTAIRRADEDLNALTAPDPTWLPLLVTPPYPSYSGNMACMGASAARTLANVFGTNDIAVTATWVGNAGNADVSRTYAGFWQLAEEQARSRVYGGIHFTFDNVASQESCRKVADYVAAHYLLRKSS
ncbi:MAG TPA: vanadium-dependent haloperoxidase [Bryobacteraceae bacterium]|jgi:hypothetical protein|nr:vanadium-dependent haloperoxidase [Bryobacteraceae bacterium]